VNYLWLLLLSFCVSFIWYFVITHSNIKLLDGYAGRLGTTTFLGMNAVMVCVWGPVGVVDWNRFYYGFVHIVHVAEEAESSSNAVADEPDLIIPWSISADAELAIGYVVAVLWVGVVGGATRIRHHLYIQQWRRDRDREEEEAAGVTASKEEGRTSVASTASPPPSPLPSKPTEPAPLNNVLVPVLLALLSMLLVHATGYDHAAGLYNGFAVGAYVAMASLLKLPSVLKFAAASLTAACWGLVLTPFFVGFAGKSGFTSMMGHVTLELLEKLIDRVRTKHRRLLRRQQVYQQEEHQQQLQMQQQGSLELQPQRLQEEQQPLQEQQQNEIETEEELELLHKPQEPYHPPHKPSRKKELVLSTKQQRRQQQRLRQLQEQQQQQQQQATQDQKENLAEAAPLRHRSWVAAPAQGAAGVWNHPKLEEDKFYSAPSKLEVV